MISITTETREPKVGQGRVPRRGGGGGNAFLLTSTLLLMLCDMGQVIKTLCLYFLGPKIKLYYFSLSEVMQIEK